MELESYFDFIQEDVIRIKGHRIDIEIVLEDYLAGASPEEILLRYPTLNLEKIHATDPLLFGEKRGGRGVSRTRAST